MTDWKQEAIKILKQLEWSGTADFQLFTMPRCPICKGIKPTEIPPRDVRPGHKPDCELARLLENRPATTSSYGLKQMAEDVVRFRQKMRSAETLQEQAKYSTLMHKVIDHLAHETGKEELIEESAHANEA